MTALIFYPTGKPIMPRSPALVYTRACHGFVVVACCEAAVYDFTHDALDLRHPRLSLNYGTTKL